MRATRRPAPRGAHDRLRTRRLPIPYTYIPYLPTKDLLLLVWIEHFISVANANLALTGLTAPQVTALNDLHTDYATAVGNHQAAYTTARATTTLRNGLRDAILLMTRQLAQQVRNSSITPDSLKQELWLRSPEALPAPAQPERPLDFTAEGRAAGFNLLRWSRSGNTKGTVYVVEVRPSGAEDWSYVDTTSRLSYKHTGQIPGTPQDYRVYALRSGLKSPASDVASVYAANPTV